MTYVVVLIKIDFQLCPSQNYVKLRRQAVFYFNPIFIMK